MRCSDAVAAIVERELDLLDPAASIALESHLERCPACAAEAHAERLLVSEFAALRGQVPFEVDVAPRVMARLASHLVPGPPDLTVRQLAWSTAAALAAGILLAAMAWNIAPDFSTTARDLGAVWNGLRGAAGQLASVALGLLSIPFKLIGTMATAASSLARLLAPLRPLGTVVASLALTGMIGTIAYFVGRDLFGQSPVTARSLSR